MYHRGKVLPNTDDFSIFGAYLHQPVQQHYIEDVQNYTKNYLLAQVLIDGMLSVQVLCTSQSSCSMLGRFSDKSSLTGRRNTKQGTGGASACDTLKGVLSLHLKCTHSTTLIH